MADVRQRPSKNPTECRDSHALLSVVLCCCCTLGILIGGYSLYQQQELEERLQVLEGEYQVLRKIVLEKKVQQAVRIKTDPDKLLRRETRNADCICPAGMF